MYERMLDDLLMHGQAQRREDLASELEMRGFSNAMSMKLASLDDHLLRDIGLSQTAPRRR
ncbi:MAG: DUF1127 domain-containing protein [Pseudomonadota bacterium]